MPEIKRIILDTERITREICDENGDSLGILSFVPSAVGFMRRLKEFEAYYQNKEFPNAEDLSDDEIVALSDEIKAKFDYLLGDSSAALFTKREPLDPVGGRPFFMQMLDVIGSLYDEYFEEQKIKAENVEKAVEKYS